MYLVNRDLLPVDMTGVHYCHVGVAIVKVTGCVPWHCSSKPIVKLPTTLHTIGSTVTMFTTLLMYSRVTYCRAGDKMDRSPGIFIRIITGCPIVHCSVVYWPHPLVLMFMGPQCNIHS